MYSFLGQDCALIEGYAQTVLQIVISLPIRMSALLLEQFIQYLDLDGDVFSFFFQQNLQSIN